MLGLSEDFISSLNEDELARLKAANDTINEFGERYRQYEGAPSHDDLASHLKEVAARQRQEAEDCQRVIDRFK